MASASSPGTIIVPELSKKLNAGLNISITPEDCEGGGYEAAEGKAYNLFIHDPLSPITTRAVNKPTFPQNSESIGDLSSLSASLHKGKLPVVLEESESLSQREGSSVWDGSSTSSSLSIASSSASSTHAFFRRRTTTEKPRQNLKASNSWNIQDDSRGKKISFISVILWPLKKLRDGYMSCMMSLDSAGDLSGLAQGSTFAASTKYFADPSMSKIDSKNYG